MLRQGFFWFGLMLLAVALLGYGVLYATQARGHSWYETSCCSGKDCAPVEDGVVTEGPNGVHVQGFGLMSPSDPRIRWSRDDRDHLCVIHGMPNTMSKLRCVYRRPNGV
jgi:hypothetical protein